MKLTAIIEIPAGSNYKYEVDKKDGRLVLDRPINQKVPFNYGFIPSSLGEDGDPTDVFVVSHDPIVPLAKVSVEIFGVLKCKDNGIQDDKLIGRLCGETFNESIHPKKAVIDSLTEYLQTYKEGFIVESFGEIEEAEVIYRTSVDRFLES
jgi:inorganic pyrophosphatase